MPEHSFLRLRGLSWWIALAISGSPFNAPADDTVQFDGRFLDLKGNTKIDLGRFSQKGYVEPGKYNLRVHVNNQPLPDDYDIYWYATENDPNKSYACLSPELVAQFGLKEDIAKNLQWIRDGQCLNTALLAGTEISGDLGQSALLVSVPQAYLEYTDSEWTRLRAGMTVSPGLLPITVSTRKPDMKMGVMTLTTSAVMVRSALTLGRGAYELTGRAIISIPAVTMTATLTIAVRKKTGSGVVTTPGAPCRH